MGIANKLNIERKQTVKEGIETKDLEYMSAADYDDTKPEYPVHLAGFFLKNSKYGEQVTIIVDDPKQGVIGVNIPKRYAELFKNLSDDEIDLVKDGCLMITKIEPNVKTPKGKTSMIEFADV